MRPHSGLHAILLSLFAILAPTLIQAQQVQPVIAEYTRAADGFFQVKNESASAQIVTFEAKSFSLNEDGTGVFRPLDPAIHLDLSTSSVRLEPQATARIFYKVHSDTLPAWLCIYSSFSAAKEGSGVNLRLMLPHTVYVYGKQQLEKSDLVVDRLCFHSTTHRLTATVQNRGLAAGRITEAEASGGRASASAGGFPLLPGGSRNLTFDWPSAHAPELLHLSLARSDLKVPVHCTVGD